MSLHVHHERLAFPTVNTHMRDSVIELFALLLSHLGPDDHVVDLGFEKDEHGHNITVTFKHDGDAELNAAIDRILLMFYSYA